MWVNKEFLSCFHRQDEICARTRFSSDSCTGKLTSVSPTPPLLPPVSREEPSLLHVQIRALHPRLGFHFPSFSGNACYCHLCIGAVVLFCFSNMSRWFSFTETGHNFLYPMISSVSVYFAARFLKVVPWHSHLHLCPQHHQASDSITPTDSSCKGRHWPLHDWPQRMLSVLTHFTQIRSALLTTTSFSS